MLKLTPKIGIANMIDLTKLPPEDAERIAHAEGFTGVAAMFARISDLEFTISRYEAALEAIADGGSMKTMTAKQCAGAAREVLP